MMRTAAPSKIDHNRGKLAMGDDNDTPDGYIPWAYLYFGQVFATMLENAAASATGEESLKSASNDFELGLRDFLEDSNLEAEGTGQPNLDEKKLVEDNKLAMQHTVDVAMTITSVVPKYVNLIKTFAEGQATFAASEKAENYGQALMDQEPLKAAAEALAGVKDEHDKEVKAKEEIDTWKGTYGGKLDTVAAYEQATPEVRKELRSLRTLKLEFDKQLAVPSYVAAAAVLPKLQPVVVALDGMKDTYDKAMVERRKVDAAHQAIQAQLNEANDLPPLTENLKKLKKKFTGVSKDFDGSYNRGEYPQALEKLKKVETAAKAVLDARGEYDTAALQEKKARDEYKKSADRMETVDNIPPTLPQIKPLQKEIKKLNKEYRKAYYARTFDEAYNKAAELWPKVEEILTFQDAAKAKEEAYDKVGNMYDALKADMDKAKELKAFTSELRAAKKKMKEAKKKWFEAYQAHDYEETERRTEPLRLAIDEVLQLDAGGPKKANDDAAAARDQAVEAYKQIEKRHSSAQQMGPYTPNLTRAKKAMDDAYADFEAKMNEMNFVAAKAAVGVLEQAIQPMEAAAGPDYVVAKVSKKAEVDKEWTNNVEELYNKVKNFKPLTSSLKDHLDNLARDFGAFSKANKEKRYVDAAEALKTLPATVKALEALREEHTNASAVLEKAYKDEWNAIETDYDNIVSKFKKGILPEIDAQLKQRKSLLKAHREPALTGDYVEAQAHFPPFKKLVEDLKKREADYNLASSARQNCEAEEKKLDPELEQALIVWKGKGAVTEGMVEAVNNFDAEWSGKYVTLFKAGKYAEAQALLVKDGTLHIAAKELAIKKISENYDAASKKKKAVDKRWRDHVKADYDKVVKFKSLNETLKTLLATFKEADSKYDAAYAAFQYDDALAMLNAGGTLLEAINALLGKEGEQSAADHDATAAANEIKGKKDDELKAMGPNEQVALLKRLRGRRGKMSKDNRALLRRLYNAMKLDDQFVQEDDRKRDELVKQLREDAKLKEAQAKWNGPPPLSTKERVEALLEVVKKQCAIFGMDVPEIRTFSDMGDREGDLEYAHFSDETGNIYLNVHPDSSFDNFAETLDTITHENAHNYQHELIRRFNANEILPTDPEYTQAMLFAVNDDDEGYVKSGEARKYDPKGANTYQKQPMEEHAFKTGPAVSRGFLGADPPPKEGS
jgi:hypothetical protein